MNINKFAKLVTEREGKKKQQNIAQVKETLRVTKDIIREYEGTDIYQLIRRI